MPLVVECQTVPHLKALTCGIEQKKMVMGMPAFLGGKNQFEKYLFYFIHRANDSFI